MCPWPLGTDWIPMIFLILLILATVPAHSEGLVEKKCREAKANCFVETVKPEPKKPSCEPIVVNNYFIREVSKYNNTLYLYAHRVDTGTNHTNRVSTFGLGYMRHENGVAFGAAVDLKANVQLSAGLDY